MSHASMLLEARTLLRGWTADGGRPHTSLALLRLAATSEICGDPEAFALP